MRCNFCSKSCQHSVLKRFRKWFLVKLDRAWWVPKLASLIICILFYSNQSLASFDFPSTLRIEHEITWWSVLSPSSSIIICQIWGWIRTIFFYCLHKQNLLVFAVWRGCGYLSALIVRLEPWVFGMLFIWTWTPTNLNTIRVEIKLKRYSYETPSLINTAEKLGMVLICWHLLAAIFNCWMIVIHASELVPALCPYLIDGIAQPFLACRLQHNYDISFCRAVGESLIRS